jgi:hypothetical protein
MRGKDGIKMGNDEIIIIHAGKWRKIAKKQRIIREDWRELRDARTQQKTGYISKNTPNFKRKIDMYANTDAIDPFTSADLCDNRLFSTGNANSRRCRLGPLGREVDEPLTSAKDRVKLKEGPGTALKATTDDIRKRYHPYLSLQKKNSCILSLHLSLVAS